MRKLGFALAALLALTVASCSSDTTCPTPAYLGYTQPTGTVAVTFTVDDSANKVFTDGNLQWKGSMIYDSATRKITKDPTWSCWDGHCLFPPLYDDGAWTSWVGAHEGVDPTRNPTPTAADHKWSITVFVTPPATGTDTYEYGLNDGSLVPRGRLVATNGWIWVGGNGTFTVAAGETAAKTATGITFPVFGTHNIRFIIDKNALDTSFAWDTSKITVKGSAWGWNEFQLFDDGTLGDAAAADNLFTFELGQYTGAGNYLPHFGLLNSGVKPEFVFVFNGKEYKNASANCISTGITAQTKTATGAWTNATISLYDATGTPAGNGNTYITVP